MVVVFSFHRSHPTCHSGVAGRRCFHFSSSSFPSSSKRCGATRGSKILHHSRLLIVNSAEHLLMHQNHHGGKLQSHRGLPTTFAFWFPLQKSCTMAIQQSSGQTRQQGLTCLFNRSRDSAVSLLLQAWDGAYAGPLCEVDKVSGRTFGCPLPYSLCP